MPTSRCGGAASSAHPLLLHALLVALAVSAARASHYDRIAMLKGVADCAPVSNCTEMAGEEYDTIDFEERVVTAFLFCDQLNVEDQQCRACADAIYAQAHTTEEGDTCVTPEHFEIAMKFCLSIMKEYGTPLPELLPPELHDKGPPEPEAIEEKRLDDEDLDSNSRLSRSSRSFSTAGSVDCGVKWQTMEGYIIYPPCANLVCALHGHPGFYPEQLQTCCLERSHYLGGPNWLTYCYYTAD